MQDVRDAVVKRIEAYEYLNEKKSGLKSEIIKVIKQQLFEEFCLVGFIKEGVDGNWNERWQITDFGKSQVTSHLNLIKINQKLESIKEEFHIN